MSVVWTLAGAYVVYAIMMVWLHPRFIYPFLQEDQPIAGFSRVSLPGGDGTPISLQVAAGEGPVLLYFMGNAGALWAFEPGLRQHLQAGRHVVALEYRGGGGRPGTPSESLLKADALKALDYARSFGKPVVVQGFSMGSGLAMHVAAHHDIDAMILEAPYSRMCRIMADRSFLPACRLPFVQTWDSLALAKDVSAPVLILHGAEDAIIQPKYSEALDRALPNARRSVIPGATHADLAAFPTVIEAIERWISAPGTP
ncbi:MAG: alpha/beta fold hydrolase [Silicimonas sp.]|nr:alpha/beta fold hydrolase [Silicimonas sp.]